MPVALISMRTSPSRGPCRSSVSMVRGAPAFQATAARVFMVMSSRWGLWGACGGAEMGVLRRWRSLSHNRGNLARFRVVGSPDNRGHVSCALAGEGAHRRSPMFRHVDAYPGDPILTLNEDFQKDPRQGKINLSIGIYFDEEGRLPVMRSVLKAETALMQTLGTRPSLPMEGAPAYRKEVQQLLFGAQHPAVAAQRIAT